MDYLKSCTTNVLALEDATSIAYELYMTTNEDARLCHLALARLRQRGILCSLEKKESWKLWLFRARNAENEVGMELDMFDLRLQEQGTLKKFFGGEQDESGGSIKSIFLGSIEAILSLSLSSQGIYRVGDWEWVYASDDDIGGGGTGILLRLNAVLSDEGSLRISTVTSNTNLRASRDAPTKSTEKLILAPSGMHAELMAEGADTAVPSLVDGEMWRSVALELLQTQTVTIEPDAPWLPVRLTDSGSSDCIMWPASLCFHYSSVRTEGKDADDVALGWRRWFNSASTVPFQNPLVAATAWNDAVSSFMNDDILLTETTSDLASANGADVPFGIHIEDESAPTPVVSQRLSEQQAALVGIYPTPPDGLLTVASSQQPTSDGMEPSTQIDQPTAGNDLLPLGEDSQMREHSTESFDGRTGYQPSQDDLFGGMEDMDFGDNEVGDDDFAYFDQPDETPDLSKSLDVHLPSSADQSMSLPPETPGVDQLHALDVTDRSDEAPSSLKDADQDQTMTGVFQSLDSGSPAAALSRQRHDPSEVLESESPVVREAENPVISLEKPLSPFGIKERLLPPPIPASAKHTDGIGETQSRRASAFAAVPFNSGLDISAKYSVPLPKRSRVIDRSAADERKFAHSKHLPGAGVLFQTTNERRASYSRQLSAAQLSQSSSESDEDVTGSDTSMSDYDTSSRMEWEEKDHGMQSYGQMHTDHVRDHEKAASSSLSVERISSILDDLIPGHRSLGTLGSLRKSDHSFSSQQHRGAATPTKSLVSFSGMVNLKKEDVSLIAQIISEQAVCATVSVTKETAISNGDGAKADAAVAHAIQLRAKEVLKYAVAELGDCDVAQLAAPRETFRPTLSQGKGPGQPPVPRPPQRSESLHAGPDCFPLPPPYIRIQRGNEHWEMLPPALQFWSVLSLGPASGEKDVQVIGICPSSEDLQSLLRTFMDDVGNAYDTRKLGVWSNVPEHEVLKRLPSFENGIMSVVMDDDVSWSGCWKAYFTACVDVGKTLAKISNLQPDRTIVVCMVDPFQNDEDTRSHLLCACFWSLWKAYQQVIQKTHRNQPHSDLVLQLLPVRLVASSGRLVSPDTDRFGELALDIYDHCPPSTLADTLEESAPLSIACAPAVEIAVPPPKRINFQLSPEPPSDLLHEGSVLHLAYALSLDKQWVTAHWIDGTGKYQNTWATTCRGRGFSDVAQELWDKTLAILVGRAVTWRVFIVAAHDFFEGAEFDQWRAVIGGKPRKQPLLVSLLAVQRDPEIQLSPPASTDTSGTGLAGPGNGVFTPVSTPQGNTHTASPDASGQTNGPATPAASDAVPSVSETDPDALLVDLRDESWGMLLPSPRTAQPQERLLNGIIFKRGDPGSSCPFDHLRALGVSLHGDLRVRPNGAVEDGPSKQAELTLREVLRMYRNLGVLSRAKSLRDLNAQGEETGSSGLLPLHIIGALRAAAALEGCL